MARNDQQEGRALQPIERLAPARIPVTQSFLDQIGVTEPQWRVLLDSTFPAARTVEAVHMALTYCRQRNLDIFKRPVNIVPMYSSTLKRYVETVWPSIFEIRATAARTGQYAGNDMPVFGPKVEREFTDVIEDERDPRNNTTKSFKLTYPEYCEYTVYRLLHGERMPFNARVFWTEIYATASRTSESPNSMWKKRPFGQLEKCAEAAALRRGFPEEVGNEYADDEMYGKVIEHLPDEVTRGHVAGQKRPPAPPPRRTPQGAQPQHKADVPADNGGDVVDADFTEMDGGGLTETDAEFLDNLRDRVAEARNEAELDTIWRDMGAVDRFAGDESSLQIAESIRSFRLARLQGGAK